MAADGARTWILTGSPGYDAVTAAPGLSDFGCKNQLPTDRMQTRVGLRA